MKACIVHSGTEYVELVYRLAGKAAEAGASVVAFPEYSGLPLLGMIPGIEKTLSGARSLSDAAASAGGAGSGILDVFRLIGPYAAQAYREAFSSVAKELGLYIISGSMILPADSDHESVMRSTGYIFAPGGELVGTYSKSHLMPVEAAWGVSPARSVPVFSLAGAAFSVPICMDASYFETFRLARFAGADVVVIPSANNEPYNMWHALRGIWPRVQESQVYGIGASMVGSFAGETFTGRSAILAPIELSPGGDGILAQALTYDQEEIVVGEIDIPLLYSYRAENPLRFNLELYRKYLPSMYRAAQNRRRREIRGDADGTEESMTS
ncbi:MAG: nitrilase-related carbon-nitrogen hydrolase [Clostridia bacterium]|nr:nitrilase-related carbon-nitrogen hydrolase [Clostridia bacterium]